VRKIAKEEVSYYTESLPPVERDVRYAESLPPVERDVRYAESLPPVERTERVLQQPRFVSRRDHQVAKRERVTYYNKSNQKNTGIIIAAVFISFVVLGSIAAGAIFFISVNPFLNPITHHSIGSRSQSIPVATGVSTVQVDIFNYAGSVNIQVEDVNFMDGQSVIAVVETFAKRSKSNSDLGEYVLDQQAETIRVSFDSNDYSGDDSYFSHDIRISKEIVLELTITTTAGNIILDTTSGTNITSLQLMTTAGMIEGDFKGDLEMSFSSGFIKTTAGEVDLNFERIIPVTNSYLTVATTAGSVEIDFDVSNVAIASNRTITFDLQATAGSIDVDFNDFNAYIPVGVRILDTQKTLGSINIDRELQPQSSNYSTAPLKIDLTLKTTVGSIDVDAN
jgi:hypothetical protein